MVKLSPAIDLTEHRKVDLTDSFGRKHRDLRISVTDRCNFRCDYCLPSEGIEWTERSEILSFSEISRIASLLVKNCGVDSIRLTGGEPLLRHRLALLVAKLSELNVELSLTTNGSQLATCAADLASAGLKRINVSLDTLRPDRFLEMTKRDSLNEVLAGIDAAVAAGLSPVKINVVLMRGRNDDEIIDFLKFGVETGVVIRFIEFMPLDAQQQWQASSVVSTEEILNKAREHFSISPSGNSRGSSPAEMFKFSQLPGAKNAKWVESGVSNNYAVASGPRVGSGSPVESGVSNNYAVASGSRVGSGSPVESGVSNNHAVVSGPRVGLGLPVDTTAGQKAWLGNETGTGRKTRAVHSDVEGVDGHDEAELGQFGIVGSVTEPFCGTCDRLRLTADGQFRNCLFTNQFLDLKSMIRHSASDDEMLDAILAEVQAKEAGHSIGQVHFIRPSKAMSQIGG